jgi:prepilin-type N-terminal cleavage/methylation domain-containing protein
LKKLIQDQKGFTLVEMIIVVIIMGILATVIVPQIGTSTEEAKLSNIKTNLKDLRNAVEIYCVQHNGVYPGGRKKDGKPGPNVAEAATAFVRQLTQYTNINGHVQATKDATHIYGPYIKPGEFPVNPYNDSNAVVCNIPTTDITVRNWDGTGTAGWHFYTNTGVLVANDSAAHATGL